MKTLLAVDIGNTNITLGVFQDSKLIRSWRMETRTSTTADEYGIKIQDLFSYSDMDPRALSGMALASVVPTLTKAFEDLAEKVFRLGCYTIRPESCGVRVLSENPKEVGADRIVNVAAVHALLGGPAIVVDFGTATTFDCASSKGEYWGGAIAPGPQLSADSLSLKTAQLPRVAIVRPKRALGRNTTECLQSGLFYGYLGLVGGILQALKREMPAKTKVVATGGLAHLFAPETPLIQKVVPDLTLQGIRILWEKNKRR